jgi:dihydrolipoamide dehydrogenase
MMDWGDNVVSNMNRGVEKICKANRVSLVAGGAIFEDEHSVRFEGPDGEGSQLTFEYAIVATGSRPIKLPGFEFDQSGFSTRKGYLRLRDVPI